MGSYMVVKLLNDANRRGISCSYDKMLLVQAEKELKKVADRIDTIFIEEFPDVSITFYIEAYKNTLNYVAGCITATVYRDDLDEHDFNDTAARITIQYPDYGDYPECINEIIDAAFFLRENLHVGDRNEIFNSNHDVYILPLMTHASKLRRCLSINMDYVVDHICPREVCSDCQYFYH